MKRFFIVPAADLVDASMIEGTLVDARESLNDAPDGTYLVLEDTSGEIVKATETVQKSKLTFNLPEGRRRRAASKPTDPEESE